MRYTRRGVLGAVGAATSGSLAGCGVLSGSSGSTPTTRAPPIEYAPPRNPPYRRWMVTPGRMERDAYTFFSAHPMRASDAPFPVTAVPYGGLISSLDYVPGLSVSQTRFGHVTPIGYAITGDYDMEEFRSTITDLMELSPVEEYGGVTVHTSPSANIALGVTDGLVIRSETGPTTPADSVKLLVDAAIGNSSRYTDASDDCLALVQRLPDADIVAGRPSGDSLPLGNAVGSGLAWTLTSPNTADMRAVFLFSDADSVDTDAVRRLTDGPATTATTGTPTMEPVVTTTGTPSMTEASTFFQGISNVQLSTDGRAVVVTGEASGDRLGPPFLPPWLPTANR